MSTTFKLSRRIAESHFDGTRRLFLSCWRTYLAYLNGDIDEPSDQNEVDSWLESIASEKVNDPKSSFYIYG